MEAQNIREKFKKKNGLIAVDGCYFRLIAGVENFVEGYEDNIVQNSNLGHGY